MMSFLLDTGMVYLVVVCYMLHWATGQWRIISLLSWLHVSANCLFFFVLPFSLGAQHALEERDGRGGEGRGGKGRGGRVGGIKFSLQHFVILSANWCIFIFSVNFVEGCAFINHGSTEAGVVRIRWWWAVGEAAIVQREFPRAAG